MNAYEQKQADRKARLEARAESARAESNSTYTRARSMSQAIPFGQPILVDHYSAGRDRNYRKRMTKTYEKAFALEDKAKHYDQKAASVGTGGISSDDPDAIKKLREELAGVERSQEMMKAANKAIRTNKTEEARTAALIEHGFTAEQAAQCLKPDFMGRVGFPAYALSNNNANARRIKQRIADLERMQARPTVAHEGNGYTYREDTDENRVMFQFPGKPDAEVRALLKRHAFKWSPSRDAWVRQLTASGVFAGELVRRELDKAE